MAVNDIDFAAASRALVALSRSIARGSSTILNSGAAGFFAGFAAFAAGAGFAGVAAGARLRRDAAGGEQTDDQRRPTGRAAPVDSLRSS